MRTKIQKWGNSLAVRIPKPFVKEARLAYGLAVDLRVDQGKIIIESPTETEYRLDDLLNGVTRQNRHNEIDSGEAVGREAW